jgi:diacylglycerol O-acyltransferase / wax synthase
VAANRTSSTLQRRFSALDVTYLYNESASNPLHVGAALIFEGQIPFDAILRSVEQRIHLLPCYRQRLAEVPFNLAYPALEDDREFRLENHLKRFRLPSGIDERQAIRRVLRDYRPVLDRSRPLWELLSFEGWPGGNTLVVSKIHHALVDGVASVRLTKRLFDHRPDAQPPEAAGHRTPAPLSSAAQRLFGATREMMVSQVDAVTDAMIQALRDPRELAGRNRQLLEGVGKMAGPPGRQIVATPWNAGTTSEGQDLVWFRTSVSDYRIIRNTFGGTTNDVLLTVLTEGAARYLSHHGYSTSGWFRIACPVSVRRPEEQTDLGNRVSMMFPTIPAAPMDPVERLTVVREETERVTPDELQNLDRLGLRWTGSFRSDSNAGFPYGVFTSTLLDQMAQPNLMALRSRMELFGMDTAAALKRMIDWRPRPGNLLARPPGISFVATHVPSAQTPIYLCGHRCLQQVGILPVSGNLGYGVTVLSYDHDRYIALGADLRLMPDLDLMKGFVQAAFEELKRAADKRRSSKAPVLMAQSPRPLED